MELWKPSHLALEVRSVYFPFLKQACTNDRRSFRTADYARYSWEWSVVRYKVTIKEILRRTWCIQIGQAPKCATGCRVLVSNDRLHMLRSRLRCHQQYFPGGTPRRCSSRMIPSPSEWHLHVDRQGHMITGATQARNGCQ